MYSTDDFIAWTGEYRQAIKAFTTEEGLETLRRSPYVSLSETRSGATQSREQDCLDVANHYVAHIPRGTYFDITKVPRPMPSTLIGAHDEDEDEETEVRDRFDTVREDYLRIRESFANAYGLPLGGRS